MSKPKVERKDSTTKEDGQQKNFGKKFEIDETYLSRITNIQNYMTAHSNISETKLQDFIKQLAEPMPVATLIRDPHKKDESRRQLIQDIVCRSKYPRSFLKSLLRDNTDMNLYPNTVNDVKKAIKFKSLITDIKVRTDRFLSKYCGSENTKTTENDNKKSKKAIKILNIMRKAKGKISLEVSLEGYVKIILDNCSDCDVSKLTWPRLRKAWRTVFHPRRKYIDPLANIIEKHKKQKAQERNIAANSNMEAVREEKEVGEGTKDSPPTIITTTTSTKTNRVNAPSKPEGSLTIA